MGGIADIAANMLAVAQKRLDVAAVNVSNISTPGFQARKTFQRIVDAREGLPVTTTAPAIGNEGAALKPTGNPLDVAVTGASMLLRSGDQFVPVVAAQLQRAADGRLTDASGRTLQAAGGGDVVVSAGIPTLLADGTLLVDGQAEARVGMFAKASIGGGENALGVSELPDEARAAVMHQGMTVPSNVDAGIELVEITRAARMAETGARTFQVYDDLIGRAASKLGEAVR